MHFSAARPRRRSLPSNERSAVFAKYRRAGSQPDSRAAQPIISAENSHRLRASASASTGGEIARFLGDFTFVSPAFDPFRELLCRRFECYRVNHFRAGEVDTPIGEMRGLAGIGVSFDGDRRQFHWEMKLERDRVSRLNEIATMARYVFRDN